MACWPREGSIISPIWVPRAKAAPMGPRRPPPPPLPRALTTPVGPGAGILVDGGNAALTGVPRPVRAPPEVTLSPPRIPRGAPPVPPGSLGWFSVPPGSLGWPPVVLLAKGPPFLPGGRAGACVGAAPRPCVTRAPPRSWRPRCVIGLPEAAPWRLALPLDVVTGFRALPFPRSREDVTLGAMISVSDGHCSRGHCGLDSSWDFQPPACLSWYGSCHHHPCRRSHASAFQPSTQCGI